MIKLIYCRLVDETSNKKAVRSSVLLFVLLLQWICFIILFKGKVDSRASLSLFFFER